MVLQLSDLHFRRKPSLDDVEWRLGAAATGIRPRRLPIPGPATGRFALRGVADAEALRKELNPDTYLVILGAGFIGCEVAATARGLGAHVDVVALDEEPMIRAIGADLGAAMRRHHGKHGIRFHLGRTVVRFLGDEVVTGVQLDDGTEISATAVLEAVGSVPNTEWLAGNSLDLSDGVLVDDNLQVIGSPRPAVAVGDIARHPNALVPSGHWRIEHWNVPTETGRRAGQTLAALPSFWSDQYELNVQSFGMPALGEPVLVDGEWDGDCIVQYRNNDALVGVIGVNRSKDLMGYRKTLS